MLQVIRDKAQGWIAWAIVILICVPFALWGIGEYLGPDPNVSIIEVNGTEVGLSEFSMAYQRNRMQAGVPQDDDNTFDERLRTATVDGLVQDELLTQTAGTQGLVISDEQLALAIQSEQAFQVSGNFNQGAYESAIYQQGYTPGTFEAAFRRSLVSGQLASGIAETAFASDADTKWLTDIELQERSFAVLRVDPARIEPPAVSDDDIAAYFEANRAAFRSPERVKVAYLRLSLDELAATISIKPGELESLFEQSGGSYATPEERSVRHILVEVAGTADDAAVQAARARIDAAAARIAGGEAFADVAAEVSDDPLSAEVGGDLGRFGRGVMDPAFDAAAFSQEVGVVGEPVRSPFGFHLIQVDDATGGEGPTFEQVKDKLAEDYRRTEAERQFYEQAERLANAAFEQPDNLEVAAEELGLEIKTTGWLTRDGDPDSPIGSEPRLVRAAFSDDVLSGGNNSEPVQLDEAVIVLRVLEHEAAADRDLADVRDDVRAAVVAERADKAADTIGRELVKKLRDGLSRDDAAAMANGAWEAFEGRSRRDPTLPPDVRALAFSMPVPTDGQVHFDGGEGQSDGFVVVALESARLTSEDKSAITNLLNAALQSDAGRSEFVSFIDWIRQGADVTIHENRMQ